MNEFKYAILRKGKVSKKSNGACYAEIYVSFRAREKLLEWSLSVPAAAVLSVMWGDTTKLYRTVTYTCWNRYCSGTIWPRTERKAEKLRGWVQKLINKFHSVVKLCSFSMYVSLDELKMSEKKNNYIEKRSKERNLKIIFEL